MTLVSYGPWNSMQRLQRRIDQIFGDALHTPAADGEGAVAWVPSVDIHEETDQFVVRADLPGVESKDISITADKGVLTLSGQRQLEHSEQRQGFARLERAAGTFRRRFTLPESVQTDTIRARHNNGVLEVTIPKAPSPEPKRVPVETH